MLLMQGLVDGHTHACQQLLRGRVSDEYPMVWTRFLVPFESNLRPDDSYINGQLACLDMIKNGTTSFADSGGIHMERVADAVLESVFIVDGHGTQAGTDFLGVYQTGMYLRVGKIIEFLTAHFFVFCFHRL